MLRGTGCAWLGNCAKACGTRKVRCSIHKGAAYFEGAQEVVGAEMAPWMRGLEEVLTL